MPAKRAITRIAGTVPDAGDAVVSWTFIVRLAPVVVRFFPNAVRYSWPRFNERTTIWWHSRLGRQRLRLSDGYHTGFGQQSTEGPMKSGILWPAARSSPIPHIPRDPVKSAALSVTRSCNGHCGINPRCLPLKKSLPYSVKGRYDDKREPHKGLDVL